MKDKDTTSEGQGSGQPMESPPSANKTPVVAPGYSVYSTTSHSCIHYWLIFSLGVFCVRCGVKQWQQSGQTQR